MKALILGGVKSGKSRHAEERAERLALANPAHRLHMLVTAQALDSEMKARIAKHKSDRGDNWNTVEAPICLAKALDALSGSDNIVVIDCLTLWLTNLLMLEDEARMQLEIEAFVTSLEAYQGSIVLVSNETNMGIMPLGELSRRYCDMVGILHQQLASLCDNVDLIVAGLAMNLKTAHG